MRNQSTKRDRQIARKTHQLFWKANLFGKNKYTFLAWTLTRPAALLIYYVLIPFQIAYGLQAIITRNFDSVSHYGLNVIYLGILYCVLWGVGGLAICENGRRASMYIQRIIFENFLQKDYEFFNTAYLGSLGLMSNKLRDMFNDYCTVLLNKFTRQFVIIVSSVAIVAYHSVLLAAATLASMILLLSFTFASGKWRLKYRRLLSEASSDLAGVMGDALSHGTTVKSFASEDYENKRLNISLSKWADTQYWSWMSSIPADLGRSLLSVVATAFLLVLTSRLYREGSISIAIVVLVQLYVIRLIMSTSEIADLIKEFDSIMSGAHQAVKTMLIEPTIKDSPVPKKLPKKTKYDIDLSDVTYRYPGAPKKLAAVKNFDLDIAQGEKVGLVGYSGSGKTTLTKLLLRFMDVSEGSIKIAGMDIRDLAQKELRSHIAYVPQEPLLFHRTIAENINYGRPSADKKSVRKAGRDAYVDEFVGELSAGYDTLVGEKGVKLSGGQRQRVAIARALLKDAPILVLDEATSALDSRSEQYIQKALWKLMKGRTAIVIAHRLSTIARMDRIVVMDKGKIVETGTHEQLLKTSGIYAKLWAHQSGGYLPTNSEV